MKRKGTKESFQKAIDTLVKVVEGEWDVRFDQIGK